MRLTLRDLQDLKPLEIRNRERLQGVLTGVSTDSRTTRSGDVFFALRGPSFDGHQFLGEALARGARVAIVEVATSHWPTTGDAPLVVVEDTTKALGTLAQLYRSKFSIPVLAIGGSSGKTTTKEMTAAVLAARLNVLRTEKNLNNHIGVPKTLFRLERKHDVAVVEIGTNHPGELKVLCEILMPTHGLLTNIGAEHLEFFESIDGVAREEGLLFEWLARHAGVALVNADDPRVVSVARACRRRISFGFSSRGAGVRGRSLWLDDRGRAQFEFSGGRIRKRRKVCLGVPGRHQAANALAAAAVGLTFGIPAAAIVEALQTFAASDKRMAVFDLRDVTVLDDTYNANPDSTIAALQTLAAMRVTGKRVAVLGDMLELGPCEAEEHRRIGEAAARLGIDYVLTYGSRAKQIHDAAKNVFAVHYDQKNVLAEYLVELVAPGDAVLIKGSRGMAMEDVVTFLVQRLRKQDLQVR
jgi:UDP-N-acetylmuramoyl-tripeptide--D-alanyl-D-alanine ligase